MHVNKLTLIFHSVSGFGIYFRRTGAGKISAL